MNEKLKVAVAGLGNRGLDVYSFELSKYPDEVEIVAVADIAKEKVEYAKEKLNIDEKCCFNSAEEMLKHEKLADVMVIATPDKLHVCQGIEALHKGYDILLEKPISPLLEECQEITRIARELDRKVVLCHVLRYAPFYRKIKNLISNGNIGEVVNIMAIENVGYFHHAHSFVRGNWRNSDESSPMILQKCCHDTDILTWLANQKAKRVSSFGSLNIFKPERSPQKKVKRCLDGCPVKDKCIYDAEKIYITNKNTGIACGVTGWPNSVLVLNPTVESVREALKEGPYGRCVFYCDNDVVDHQEINIELENNATISLTMSAFSAAISRYLKVMGTHGEIEGDMEKNTISVRVFGEEDYTIDLDEIQITKSKHGGGDTRLVREFIDYIRGNGEKVTLSITSLEESIESHYIALAAEKSRLNHGKVIDIEGYRV